MGTAVTRELSPQLAIRLASAPYFVATKWAAFLGRGKNDFRYSRDLEDIVIIVDGRPELVDETEKVDQRLRRHLAGIFHSLLENREFVDNLAGYLPAQERSREQIIRSRMERLAAIA